MASRMPENHTLRLSPHPLTLPLLRQHLPFRLPNIRLTGGLKIKRIQTPHRLAPHAIRHCFLTSAEIQTFAIAVVDVTRDGVEGEVILGVGFPVDGFVVDDGLDGFAVAARAVAGHVPVEGYVEGGGFHTFGAAGDEGVVVGGEGLVNDGKSSWEKQDGKSQEELHGCNGWWDWS